MSDPLKPVSPQIGSVIGIDRMDGLDRQKLDARVKLELLCQETKNRLGRDPRAGGFVFVARPRVILQLLIDMSINGEIELERPVIAGRAGADVVGRWQRVPVVVRSTTVGDSLLCVRDDLLPESKMIDRRRASEIRVAAHGRRLESLKES